MQKSSANGDTIVVKFFRRQQSISKPDFHRVRAYADSIDRLVRLMRAEVENQVSLVEDNADLALSQTVTSSLQSFYESGVAFEPLVAEPYKEISPGLQIGLDTENHAAHVVASARTLSTYDADGQDSRIARLSINPVFSKPETPKWVTLESKIDAAAFNNAAFLEIDLISHNEIASKNSVDIPQVFHVFLRVSEPDGTHKDHLRRSLPVSSVPMAQTISFDKSHLDTLEIKEGAWCTMIFELPLKGAYTFHLDWFAARRQTV